MRSCCWAVCSTACCWCMGCCAVVYCKPLWACGYGMLHMVVQSRSQKQQVCTVCTECTFPAAAVGCTTCYCVSLNSRALSVFVHLPHSYCHSSTFGKPMRLCACRAAAGTQAFPVLHRYLWFYL